MDGGLFAAGRQARPVVANLRAKLKRSGASRKKDQAQPVGEARRGEASDGGGTRPKSSSSCRGRARRSTFLSSALALIQGGLAGGRASSSLAEQHRLAPLLSHSVITHALTPHNPSPSPMLRLSQRVSPSLPHGTYLPSPTQVKKHALSRERPSLTEHITALQQALISRDAPAAHLWGAIICQGASSMGRGPSKRVHPGSNTVWCANQRGPPLMPSSSGSHEHLAINKTGKHPVIAIGDGWAWLRLKHSVTWLRPPH